MESICKGGAIALALAACVAQAGAGEIVGGSALLDAGSHAQPERWLGAGQFDFYNVYARRWHAAGWPVHARFGRVGSA